MAGADSAPQWLKDAEKERSRGNTAEAKLLVQRALDLEPHNEEA